MASYFQYVRRLFFTISNQKKELLILIEKYLTDEVSCSEFIKPIDRKLANAKKIAKQLQFELDEEMGQVIDPLFVEMLIMIHQEFESNHNEINGGFENSQLFYNFVFQEYKKLSIEFA